jgi:hypothetical protein
VILGEQTFGKQAPARSARILLVRRVPAGIALLILVLAGCGGSSKPEAFPGPALDKAREFARRHAELDLPHPEAEAVAETYGTHGDGVCERDPENHKTLNLTGGESRAEQEQLLREANLIIDIYCPWMPRFRKAVVG